MNSEIFTLQKQIRRNTKQRLAILDEIRKLKSHPTAEELYIHLKTIIPNISISTVYRNLEILKTMGLVIKLETSKNQSRFDGTTFSHHHITCVKCGKIEDIKGLQIQNFSDIIENITNFEDIESKTEFLGVCPQCKEEKRQNELSNNGHCEKQTKKL